jgi:hypothetical protein
MSSFGCADAAVCGNVNCKDMNNTTTKLLCKNCRAVSYCSRACQVAAWKQHKAPCRQRLSFTPPSTADYCKGLTSITIEDTGTALGRVVRAQEKFLLGDTVIAEQPTLSWKAGDGAAMVRAFLAANDTTRGLVLGK